MDKNDKNNDMEKKLAKVLRKIWLGALLGGSLFNLVNLNEDDASKAAEEYLESLESNHDLNEKIDSLIEGFTMK